MVPRPTLANDVRAAAARSQQNAVQLPELTLPEEKTVASGNGVLVYITLAEPMLFLQGFNHQDETNRTTAMLRGNLIIRVTKTAKIKAISLNFRGKARTDWPEGIPPRNTDFFEEQILNRHTWPFFNAQFVTAEDGHGADFVRLAQPPGTTVPSAQASSNGRVTFDQFARSGSPGSNGVTSREQKRHSLQLNHSRSFGKSEGASNGVSIAQKGYRAFYPGDYVYNFELPLDSRLPETIAVELGKVKYELEATIERASTFRGNIVGAKEVTLIRAPTEGALEQIEPIAISRTWDDQLHYDIIISGKSFPLGAQVPIAFKLTPLAKVQCHIIRVYLTEIIEYYCSNKSVHRLEPARKLLLFEKRADGPSTSTFPGSSIRILAGGGVDHDAREAAARGVELPGHANSLLGNLNGEHNAGPTEMEFTVQLPSCHGWDETEKSQRVHFDTTYSNIQVHHWIKIIMRLSKPDTQNPAKRRHFEISIDSPLHLLACQAAQANLALPAYTSPEDGATGSHSMNPRECQCPAYTQRCVPEPPSTRARSNTRGARDGPSVGQYVSVAPPPAAHLLVNGEGPRPMHLLRNPSFNPPAFDAEVPPPPLMTPPPEYNSVFRDDEGLADYFARLADEIGDEDAHVTPGREVYGASSRGRVHLPLTPGGRVHRSMDEQRTWLPPGHAS